MRSHDRAPGEDATVDIFAVNIAVSSQTILPRLPDVLDGHHTSSMPTCYAFILLFITLECVANAGIHWMEFSPSIKIPER